MAGTVPAVLPLAVAPLLIPPPIVLAAVALAHAECLRIVANHNQAAVLLQYTALYNNENIVKDMSTI
jgi:hypothetical protein